MLWGMTLAQAVLPVSLCQAQLWFPRQVWGAAPCQALPPLPQAWLTV